MQYNGRFRSNKRDKRLLKARLKLASIATISIIGIALIWLFVSLLSSPQSGHSVKTKLKATPDSSSQTTTPTSAQPVSNSYFNLNLPAGYVAQSQSIGQSGNLYTQTIIGTSTNGSQIVAIAITSGDLASNPSYVLRTSKPGEYIPTTNMIAGQKVTVFTDNQTSNVVAFWPHGQYLATISVSGGYVDVSSGGSQNPEMTVLSNLLSGWQWRSN
jgi:hypothetical protein